MIDAYNTHIISSFAPHQKSLHFLQRLIHDIICYNFVFVGPVDKFNGNGTKCDPDDIRLGPRIETYKLAVDGFAYVLVREAKILNTLPEQQAALPLEQQLWAFNL